MNERNRVHIMLDLETMGAGFNAAIISAGLVAFKVTDELEPDILGRLEVAVDLESAVKHGGIIDPSTVMWWMQQEQEQARVAYLGKQYQFLSIGAALNELGHFIRNYSVVKPLPLIWGNGAEFDNVILRRAYERVELTVPWGFRQSRCFRTTQALFPQIPEPEFQGTKHSALSDAMHQARWLNRILGA